MLQLFNLEPIKKENLGEIIFLDFSENWNNKLNCFSFTTIRPISSKYKIGDNIYIRLKERFYGHAKVVDIKIFSIKEIIDLGIYFFDTGLDKKAFFDMMNNMYSKKRWWKDENTKMEVIFIQKIKQLEIDFCQCTQ